MSRRTFVQHCLLSMAPRERSDREKSKYQAKNFSLHRFNLTDPKIKHFDIIIYYFNKMCLLNTKNNH